MHSSDSTGVAADRARALSTGSWPVLSTSAGALVTAHGAQSTLAAATTRAHPYPPKARISAARLVVIH